MDTIPGGAIIPFTDSFNYPVSHPHQRGDNKDSAREIPGT